MELRELKIQNIARKTGMSVVSATDKVEKLEAAGVGFDAIYAHLMGDSKSTGNSLSRWIS